MVTAEHDFPTEDLVLSLRAGGYVEVGPSDHLAIDLRYASTRNFLGRAVYGGFDRLLLHPSAAAKLAQSVAWLGAQASGHRLLVLDGLRPNRIQRLFWAAVADTPQQKYVADPAIGSIHGYGFAVDATLLGPDGLECDMGTGFDDFSEVSEPQREGAFLAAGALTKVQVENRERLRGVMMAGGFQPIAIEWWHFDALPPDFVRQRFALTE